MGTHHVKSLYLPAGCDWGRQIEYLKSQIMAGVPVLIWHGDGILAYLVADPDRNLLDDRWIATLLRAAADEIYRLASEEIGE